MPYDTISDLPDTVKESLPAEAAEIWMSAYNSAEKAGRSEAERARIAWGAVKAAGWEKQEDGSWVKKEAQKEELEHFYQMAKGVFPGWLMEIINKAARLYQDRKDKGSRQVQADQIEKQSVKKHLITGILKVDDEKQIVTGIVLEPDVEDAQGDIISAEEIEKAAHGFLAKSRVVGKGHAEVAKAEVVESYVAPQDFVIGGEQVRKGTWLMSVKIHDPELWDEVKRGEITGFSIGAIGIRQSA